jgi:hypothetical protein
MFGFVTDVAKSLRHNAATYLATMYPWAYFSRPSNMAFHDLSMVLKPPKNLIYLLVLSLKFIPSPRVNVPWKAFEEHTFARFDRELKVKVFMADQEDDGSYNPDCIMFHLAILTQQRLLLICFKLIRYGHLIWCGVAPAGTRSLGCSL